MLTECCYWNGGFWLIFVVAIGMMTVFGGGTDSAETNTSEDAAETALANFEEMAAEAERRNKPKRKQAEAAIQVAEEKANKLARVKVSAEVEWKTGMIPKLPDGYHLWSISAGTRCL